MQKVDFNSEKERLLNNINSENSKKQEKRAVENFNSFLKAKNVTISDNLVNDTGRLDIYLEEYLCTIRKSDGGKLKSGSLHAMRYALNRMFIREHNCDITDKTKFPKSSLIMKSLVVDLKKEGLGSVTHYKKINNGDVAKIYESLDHKVPQQLQWLLFFIIQLFFCRRGRENIEKFSKATFQIATDENGRRYIYQAIDEFTKNHRESDTEMSIGGRAYENQECPSKCPVKIFEFYVSKLNDSCSRLWQFPKSSFIESEESWYTNRPVGINTISKWMQKISVFCHLSQSYSNHCIRVTSISILGEKHSENEIKEISGHRSIGALGIYKKISEEKRFAMSATLSEVCLPSGSGSNTNVMRKTVETTETEEIQENQQISSTSSPFVFNNCSGVTINIIKQ